MAIWRGGHFLARAHFVEINISIRFFANQNLLGEDEETIQIFSNKFFEAISASKWPPRPNVTSPSYPSWPICVAFLISDALGSLVKSFNVLTED